MGVLTDIVVAHASQAKEVLAADVPSEAFSGFDAKGLDPVMLAMLNAIMTDTDYDPGWVDALTSLGGDEDDGPWLFQIPAEMVSRLAALSAMELARIATAWGVTDQLVDAGPEEVETLLSELARFAREAIAAKKELLMWISL
jgi:hypothetical protein